ncbi:MAG TPA: transaldolase [Hyphomicrobiaceae bacterium]|nr:transaldolase [Hyphomicrobiaceae bacterium]
MKCANVDDLQIRIFADGANLNDVRAMAADPRISGFTTNPTLMRAAGVADYRAFARSVLGIVGDRPVSFEVLADDFPTMEAEAREIASWGRNVYVKVPVTDTRGTSAAPLVARLSRSGIKLNVTAVMTLDQVGEMCAALAEAVPAIISVFAGRIADTGRDPVPHMLEALRLMRSRPRAELLWASPRELLNVFQADATGCHIITVTPELLRKLELVGKDLGVYSRETVAMFHRDAVAANYAIPIASVEALS